MSATGWNRFYDPLQLTPHEPEPGGEDFADSPMTCEIEAQCWKDIIYLVGTGKFYLLTEEIHNQLVEASDNLRQWVEIEDAGQRMVKLSQNAGLMDCLMPAKPLNFLSEAKRSEYEQYEIEEKRLQAEVDRWRRAAHAPGRWNAHERERAEIQRHTTSQALDDTRLKMVMLRREAEGLAEDAGYVHQGNAYYGPWEAEIEAALEAYRTARHAVIREYRSLKDAGETHTARDALREFQNFLAQCEEDPPLEASQRCEQLAGVAHWLTRSIQGDLKTYIDSILELASLGIATPEWALSSESLGKGMDYFDHYNDQLKAAQTLYEEVDRKLQQWDAGTGGRTGGVGLPIFLFEDERQQYQQLNTELDELKNKAERAVASMTPRRVLFWHADMADERASLGYEKRTIDLLVRSDWPLREYTSAASDRSLCHLSLRQVMGDLKDAACQALLEDLEQDGALPATLWELPEQAMHNWLLSQGCQALEWRAEWHEAPLGFFQPEAFFASLEQGGIEVESLQDGQAKTDWGKTLQGLLFTGPLNDKLRVFDASAQAQLLRLVALTRGDLYQAVPAAVPQEIEFGEEPKESLEKMPTSAGLSGKHRQEREIGTPGRWEPVRNTKAKVSQEYKWEAKGTYDLAKGEVRLGRLNLPDEAKAREYRIRFENEQETGERSLGYYSLQADAVAKGFAGASLALASEVGLGLDTQGGLNITGLDWAEHKATPAKLQLFAGVKLGVELSCALRWKPPRSLATQVPHIRALDELTGATAADKLTHWGTVGMARLAAEGAYAVGGELDFSIGIANGRFVLHAKAGLFAGLGYSGSVSIEIEPRKLDLWITMLNQALKDNGYERVDWIDEEAFEGLSQLAFAATVTLLHTGLLFAKGRDGLQQIVNYFHREDNAQQIAADLLEDQRQDEIGEWIQKLPPEALGPLLNLLITPTSGVALDLQQRAIANCLKWVQRGATRYSAVTPCSPQILFEKAVARMSSDGDFTHTVSTITPRAGQYAVAYDSGAYERLREEIESFNPRERSYCPNRHRLDEFMQRESGSDNPEPLRARQNYRTIVDRLSLHISYCQT